MKIRGNFAFLACSAFALVVLVGAYAAGQNAPASTNSTQTTSTSQQNRAAIFIKGTVSDESGAIVPNATVVLEEEGHGSVEAKTGQDGKFSFLSLRAGTFRVHVKAEGFKPVVTEAMELALGETKQIDVVLHVGTYSGPMVEAPAPVAQPSASALPGIEFSDEPKFTVAGVTDWSNAGLHGSDVQAKTSESLNRDTVALKSSADAGASGASAAAGGAPGKASEAEAHRLAGDAYEKKGDSLAAEREYEAAVRLDPSEANYFAWGTELLVHKAIQPAIEVYGRGAAAHPRSARMLMGLGAALYASRAYEDAARRVCQAVDLDPTDTTPYMVLGKIQASSADALPCADTALADFVHRRPENPEANYYYAMALWKRSQDPFTRNEMKALLAKAPDLPEALLQLGMLYAYDDHLDWAIRMYTAAVKSNPDFGEAHYRLALSYKRTGQQGKAHEEFATYKRIQKTEEEQAERDRKELQQFVVVLKEEKKQKD